MILKSSPIKIIISTLLIAFTSIGHTSDNTRPTLISITPDRTTADVSESEQTVIFTIDATDESGIDWDSSFIYFMTTANFCYREDTDGEVTCTFRQAITMAPYT